MTQRVLFIGGTGIISSACSPLAIQRGMELYLFNRGQSLRQAPEGARLLAGDIRQDARALAQAVDEHAIDVVVNWIAYHPDEVRRDIELLKGKLKQYVFISSASAYAKPVPRLPITEETPLNNPFWEYSRNKQACEEALMDAYASEGFPATIVRPSHTYDKTLLPFNGRWTVVERMRQGKPVVVHGDGSSLWVLTHHADFAKGFVGLLGRQEAVGQTYHITSDELLSWNAIYAMVAEAAGAEFRPVYAPSSLIAEYDADLGAGLLGDKAHSVIFDNRKIKALVPEFEATIPFAQGVQEIIAWHEANPQFKVIDEVHDALQERIVADMATLLHKS
jgi:nucleoside-diphosphate-sugar epimerase